MQPPIAQQDPLNTSDAVILTRERLEPLAQRAAAPDRAAGALATFVGVVRAERDERGRELLALDYSAYEPMAERVMRRIVAAARLRHAPLAIQLAHRLGRLEVGEASVAVTVWAAHRGEAFAACREVIEELKVSVPIFKQEIWADGSASWVEGV